MRLELEERLGRRERCAAGNRDMLDRRRRPGVEYDEKK